MRVYNYRTHDWRPGAVLRKPLLETRIAVVTTAAFHLPDQTPFDESVKGDDFSYREIPADADLFSLGIAHKSDAFDASGIEADENLALPLEDLRDMVRDGEVGSANARHFSFMGSIPPRSDSCRRPRPRSRPCSPKTGRTPSCSPPSDRSAISPPG